MDFSEFMEKLYNAGWCAPGDAQWQNIEALWDELCEKGTVTPKRPANNGNQAELESELFITTILGPQKDPNIPGF